MILHPCPLVRDPNKLCAVSNVFGDLKKNLNTLTIRPRNNIRVGTLRVIDHYIIVFSVYQYFKNVKRVLYNNV